jgi:hypothetical protein
MSVEQSKSTNVLEITGFGLTRKVFIGEEELTPFHANKLRNHSPEGYNWGYKGSGPAHLALSILLKGLEGNYSFEDVDGVALKLYQEFKEEVVAVLPTNFKIQINVQDWVNSKILNKPYFLPTELKFYTGDIFVPMLVCFNLYSFKKGIFDETTLEYSILEKLKEKNKLVHYADFLRRMTLFIHPLHKEEIYRKVHFDAANKVYIIYGGDADGRKEWYGLTTDLKPHPNNSQKDA